MVKKVQERAMNKASEQQIIELNRELDMLKGAQDKLRNEALKWAEKRDQLNEEIRAVRLEAQNYKERRDELNYEVHRLKSLRQVNSDEYRKTLEELKSLRQKMREAAARLPQKCSKSLEAEIKKIEWKIQTESLSLAEESKLIEQVKTLERQFAPYSEIRDKKDKIEKLQKKAQATRDEMIIYSKKISDIAKESQKFHERMTGKLEKVKELKVKADEMHRQYMENKDKANELHTKYAEILTQIKALRQTIQEKEAKAKAKQYADLLDKLERDALEKLKSGEKLTFEEFKILAEKRKI